MRRDARYRAVLEIASGGMADVVLAVRNDGTSTSPVALKQLKAHLVDEPELVASFVDEARIASRIVHPNVVRVQDVEMLGDKLVIVMEYVDGVTVANLLRAMKQRGEPVPVPVVRRIACEALRGLHAAHELADPAGVPLSVVHRDVSPQNILVGVDGVARVTDFGIAHVAGRIAATRTHAIKGKLGYLSPEQIWRRRVDRRADVFAAAIVVWELLTGKDLFIASSEAETLAMILREPIVPPGQERMDVPLTLDEACLRALEREPDARFASAEDFARAIEETGPLATQEEVATLVRAVAGEGLADRARRFAEALSEPSTPPIAVPTATRRPWVAPLTMLLVGGLVGGGVVALSRREVTPARAEPASPAAIPMTASSSSPPVATGSAPAIASASSEATPSESASSEPPLSFELPPTAGDRRPKPRGAKPRTKATKADAGRPYIPDDL